MNRAIAVLLAAFCVTGLSGCIGHLGSKPGVYDVHKAKVQFRDRELHLTCVTPLAPHPPAVMILFASGDAGWLGASKWIFEHMAERGYYVAAINSREMVKAQKASGKKLSLSDGTLDLAAIIEGAKKSLGLPDKMPTILTGDSRGSGMVIFGAANKKLQPGLAGAVAVALTREADYLQAPDPSLHIPGVETDDKGRIQLYPAISRVGSLPIAVIQSAGDKYVTGAEARTLFGPDTPTRRLYAVNAKNHGFSGGRDEMLKDLDEALTWIIAMPPRESAPAQ
jgi:hypothetical protein